ncbi:unnamed protein product [Rotaria sordida]|uniref:Uncharacterized protein n=1 Tax=Rotaria sordida TaxID=392033 RepID=A0A815KZF9_9BILA|nr:unnamed protein product [Rotaria sordida]
MAQKLVDLIKNKLGDDEIYGQEIDDRINIEDLKKIYDSIIDEYKSVGDNDKVRDDDQRTRYLISIITSLHRLSRKILANKILLDHELYVVICNKLSDTLVQWKNEQNLNEIKSEYFQNIVQLFSKLTYWSGAGEKETIEKIVLDEKFVKPIELCLSSINENDSLLFNNNMNNIHNFSNLIRNMEFFCEYQSMDKSHLILLTNSIMNYIYINYEPNLILFDLDYDKGINKKILNQDQQDMKYDLLSSCLEYFRFYCGKDRDDVCQQFMDKSFEKLKQIIEYAAKQIHEWTGRITARIQSNVIVVLNNFCLYESCLSIISHDDIIIQSLISIICNMDLYNQVDPESSCGSASDLINDISHVLLEMIKDNKELLIMLKNHKTVKENLIGRCFPIWAFNVPSLISQILTDDEIKNLLNIKSLTESLTSFLINYSEHGGTQRFSNDVLNFLTGLTALAVHEEARKEFVRLEGLETLIGCTIINYEPDPFNLPRKFINPNTIRSRSLDLLWVLVRDKEVAAAIKSMRPDIIQHLQEKISKENKTIAQNIIRELQEKSEIITEKNLDVKSKKQVQE